MKFKQDIYTQNRGNYSEFFELHCRKCGCKIAKYQKDGAGHLLRIYVDRISENNDLLNFEVDKKIICPNCQRLLGLGYLYPKEKRPAYILFQDTIIKKPINLIRHYYCVFMSLIKRK